MYEICSKLVIKTLEERQCRRSGVFIVNFEQIRKHCDGISIVDIKQVNVSWKSAYTTFC